MRNDRASTLGHFESCHGQANLVCFQVSSIIKCYRRHENRSIAFDTGEENAIKLLKYRYISQQQNNIYIK